LFKFKQLQQALCSVQSWVLQLTRYLLFTPSLEKSEVI